MILNLNEAREQAMQNCDGRTLHGRVSETDYFVISKEQQERGCDENEVSQGR